MPVKNPFVLDRSIASRLSRRFACLSLGAAAAAVSLFAPTSAEATVYYWDTDSTNPGFGTAGGIWGVNPFWSIDSGGASAGANITTTTADDLNFGTGTLGLGAGTLTGPSPSQGFLSMTFGSASGAIAVSNGTLDLAAVSTITVNNAADSISSVLQGTGGITKAGAGTLTLSGTNTYTGVTTFGAGIVNVATLSDYGVASSLGARTAGQEGASNVGLRFLGGTLQYTGATAQSTNRQIRIGIAGGTIDASGSSPAATIAFTYNGANTDLFDTGGTRTLTLAGTNTGNNLFAIVLANQGGSATSLTKTGAGTWELASAQTYTGTTLIRNGTLILSGNRTVTSGGVTLGDTAGQNPILSITNGNFSMNGTFVVGQQANTSTVNQSAGSLTLTGTQLIMGNNIAGSVGVYNLSGGTLAGSASTTRGVILGTNNSTTGTFNLSGTGNLAMGTSCLQVGRSDSGATSSTGTFNQTGGTAAIGTLSIGGGAGTLNAGTIGTLNLTGGTFTAASFIFLAASNNSTANITIGGTAQVTLPAFPTARGTGATATINFDGGTLTPAAASTAYLGGLTNAFLTANGAKLNVPSGRDITVSQVLQNATAQAGTLTKLGNGTLTLTGANTYSGATTVSAGTLNFFTPSSVGGLTVADNATLGLKMTSTSTSVLGAANNPSMTFGTAGTSALAIDFNTLTNPTVPVVNLGSGTLTVNGTVNVSLANTSSLTTTANNTTLALLSYGARSGAGTYNLTTTSAGHSTFALNDTAGALYLSVDAKPITWTGGFDNHWTDDVLAAPKNWVLPDNSQTDFIAGDTVNFTNTASAFNVDLAKNVNPGVVTFSNTSNAYTIGSVGGFGITAGKLIVSGGGAVTITTANTYSGGTTLSAGTLNVNTPTALGTGPITVSGGTLDNTSGGAIVMTANSPQNWNGDVTFTGTSDLDMGTGTVTVSGGGTVRTATVAAGTLSIGKISAPAHGFTKQGPGTLVVGSVGDGAAGSFAAGNLNVAAGTLQINRTGAPVATSGDFYASGLTGPGTIVNGAATERWVYDDLAGTATFPGTLADGGAGRLGLNKLGTGTQVLSGTNTFTGQMTMSAGIVNVTSLSDYGVPSAIGARLDTQDVSTNVGLRFLGGTLQYTGSTPQSTNRQIRVGVAGGTIDASGSDPSATLSFTHTGTNADLFDTGGTRTLTLTGTNTGNNVFAISLVNESVNATSLTKTGPGNWVLTGVSTHTGTTTVSGGTLTLGNAFAVQNSTVSLGVANGLAFSAGLGTFNLGGLTGTGNQALVDLGASAVTLSVGANNANTTYAGILSGAGAALTKVGSGTLTLLGANSYTGKTTITGNGSTGILQVGANEVIPDVSVVELSLGGKLEVQNFTETIGGLTTTTGPNSLVQNKETGGTGVGTLIINTAGNDYTFDGILRDRSGVLAIQKTGAGTQIFTDTTSSDNISFTGGLTVNGGTLKLSDSGNGRAIGTFASTVTNNATLALENLGGANQTFARPINGTGGVVIPATNVGPITLSVASGYTGPTTVNAGTLLVTGSLTGTSGVTVNSGATLGGTGSVPGVTVNAGAVLAPGAGLGTLTTGNLILDALSTSAFELTTGNTTAGGGINDLVVVNGNLTLDGTLTVNEVGGPLNVGPYVLFDYSGTLTDNGLTIDPAFLAAHPGASISIDNANTAVLLNVPEPSAAVALLGGAAFLLARRRPRKA